MHMWAGLIASSWKGNHRRVSAFVSNTSLTSPLKCHIRLLFCAWYCALCKGNHLLEVFHWHCFCPVQFWIHDGYPVTWLELSLLCGLGQFVFKFCIENNPSYVINQPSVLFRFGRFTVAALQSKVEQYERETNRLKKALERSDKYIEELESQVAQLKHSDEVKEDMDALCQRAPSADGKGPKGSDEVVASQNQGDSARKQAGAATSTSASHLTTSSCRRADTSSARQESTSKTETNCPKNKDRYPKPTEMLLAMRETPMDAYLEGEWGSKPSDCAPYKEEELYDLQAPCTPLSLSCLQLNTPENRENSVIKAGSSKKHTNHLRKLVFDDFCDSPNACNNNSSEDDVSKSENEKKSDHFVSPKTGFWDCCSTSYAQSLEFDSSERNTIANSVGEIPSKLSERSGSCMSKRLNCIRSLEMNRTRTSSEASMDAAYLDKISELDSMMSESDNSKSPCSNGFKSVELEGSSKSPRGSEFLEEPDKLEEGPKLNLSKNALSTDQLENGGEWKPSSFFLLSPSDQEMSEDFSLHPSSNSGASEIKPQSCLFQTEFSQGVLLSGSHGLFEEQRFGSSLFKMSSEMQSLHSHLQSPWSTSFVPEKRNKNANQSTKRKIQSSLSNASPSKATKSWLPREMPCGFVLKGVRSLSTLL